MERQRIIAILVSFAILVNGLGVPAFAAGGPATWSPAEEAAYAEREAESAHVETFAGGDSALGVIVVILVVAVVVYLVWYWYEHEHGMAAATPEETEAIMLGAMATAPAHSPDPSRPADITGDEEEPHPTSR